MLFFECPVIRLHIWLVFDVTSAMAICRHDDPFGQWRAPPQMASIPTDLVSNVKNEVHG